MKIQRWLEPDELFAKNDSEKIWLKYCGFLNLSINEFMIIQKALLMDQIDMISGCPIGQKIMNMQKPRNVDEFRRIVPFTTYEDYQPFLCDRIDDALPVKSVIWAHTSGRGGFVKWAPYSLDNFSRLADDTLAAFILSAAKARGEVNIREGERVVLNLPPVPYLTGIMGFAVAQRIGFRAIPPLDEAEKMEFQARIEASFKTALREGVDFAASIAVVLNKVGDSFGQLGKNTRLSYTSLNPVTVARLLRGMLISKLARRPLLPKDLWKLKGLVCGGTDTSIFRDRITQYWGITPLDVYGATETGIIAMQAWDKNWMTFLPHTNFYEFIPENESRLCQQNKEYVPKTLLMDEVEEGKIYELIVSNFHGGPFLRYKIGDLVKIVALKNDATGVILPQMDFQRRADDIIDIAGFSRLDEKTIWRAIQNLNIPYEDWVARKETVENTPVLHVYLELVNEANSHDVGLLIDEQLCILDEHYRNLKSMTGIEPLLVTFFNKGTFQKYLNKKQAEGFDLAHLKPPHINPSDVVLNELLNCG